ncbi:hypothetical protein SPRG_15683 [Saprolegnia parasitica CBS 223.65]|uniref:Uncharacterized protein n=1 Tax=Saprolegnia parasitica (strain CBS 223.65) TaxID=695850 RepID=A0A067BQW0_SAPPC|nr:hypothetical protein SPRG_15683 [Saprolegnia parasitica CBS 223.65]KDO19160.1 hypothetical protein SPRG_15683 [Saprolegnia parasitica CBS 223.65]|eukprot:XP_012210130.1 hypothetical protein SPRG_15683 [Saprolegnia parasitica CBS 223.65]
MDGGNCTQDDMTLRSAVMDSPVWTNCSNAAGATLRSIEPQDAESAKTLCGSATCTAFLSSMEKQTPNCVLVGDTPKNSMNLRTMFQISYGCTPAAAGAQCSLIDSVNFKTATETPVWTNCSTFLKLPQDTTVDKVMLEKNANATSLAAGFCNSTCPQYLLSVMKLLPSCGMEGRDHSDPTLLYTLCPNAKPVNKSGASTLSVSLWSCVVVLVTAVATLF